MSQFQNPEGLDRQSFTVLNSFGTNLISLVQAACTETDVIRNLFTKLVLKRYSNSSKLRF